jgi:hypothetical protein
VSIAARVQGKARTTTKRFSERAGEGFEWGLQRVLSTHKPISLNPYQEAFCQWDALRLGITVEESRRRLSASLQTFPGGHAGLAFRIFNDISHSLYQPFATDSEGEVYSAYQFHGPAHFLRTLSQPPPKWDDTHPVVRAFGGVADVTILDFGCGMAQPSISLAQRFRAGGADVHLLLADIPTLRFEFVGWLAGEWGFDAKTFECRPDHPMPELPSCDVLIAREFFEHVYDPVSYMRALDCSVNPGGMLVTNVSDHHNEFMHVSPNLAALRNALDALGYETVVANRVFRKRVGLVSV